MWYTMTMAVPRSFIVLITPKLFLGCAYAGLSVTLVNPLYREEEVIHQLRDTNSVVSKEYRLAIIDPRVIV